MFPLAGDSGAKDHYLKIRIEAFRTVMRRILFTKKGCISLKFSSPECYESLVVENIQDRDKPYKKITRMVNKDNAFDVAYMDFKKALDWSTWQPCQKSKGPWDVGKNSKLDPKWQEGKSKQ